METLNDLRSSALCFILSFLLIPIFIGWYFLGKSLKSLSRTNAGFSAPHKLFKAGWIIVLIGLIMLVLYIFAPFIINEVVGVSAGSPSAAQYVLYGVITSVSQTLSITVLVAFIIGGFIVDLGVVFSFYRVGTACNNDLIQIASILQIFIPIIGPILLFLGLNDAVDKVNAAKRPADGSTG